MCGTAAPTGDPRQHCTPAAARRLFQTAMARLCASVLYTTQPLSAAMRRRRSGMRGTAAPTATRAAQCSHSCSAHTKMAASMLHVSKNKHTVWGGAPAVLAFPQRRGGEGAGRAARRHRPRPAQRNARTAALRTRRWPHLCCMCPKTSALCGAARLPCSLSRSDAAGKERDARHDGTDHDPRAAASVMADVEPGWEQGRVAEASARCVFHLDFTVFVAVIESSHRSFPSVVADVEPGWEHRRVAEVVSAWCV